VTPEIRSYDASADELWAASFLEGTLGGRLQARRSELIDVLAPGLGLVAVLEGDPVGLATYRIDSDAVELTAFAAEPRGHGIGSRLLEALEAVVRAVPRDRLWAVTTNDNIDALAFYQRRGFRLREVRIGAVDAARASLKPAIPPIGAYGIPMHDEFELERRLQAGGGG
jgi:GNAT superfamily N-acetyltransferase